MYNESETDLLSGALDILSNGTEDKKEVSASNEVKEDALYIPKDYQIFSTHNNEATGKREIADTYMCDRKKGIVPNLKARKKADLMKNAFPKKTFFVEATYIMIETGKAPKEVKEIYYQTK